MRRPAVRLLVIVAAYLVATLIASVILNPSHPRAFALTPIVLALIAGLVAALTLGPLARRLEFPVGTRLVILVVVIYALSTLSNEIEAVLFIKNAGLRGFLTGLVLAIALGIALAFASPPDRTDTPLKVAHLGWLWRVPVAAIVWVPVYLSFAAADAPFVHRYYAETGTPFVVPSGGVVASGELIRGVLHAIVLGGLAAILAGTGTNWLKTWWWVAVAFAVLNGWLPLIQHTDWPYFLRAANAVEITGDAIVYGVIITWLFHKKAHVRQKVHA
jgi:hypothetical protein